MPRWLEYTSRPSKPHTHPTRLTCLVGQDPFKPQTTRDRDLAAWLGTEGSLSGADFGGIFLNVPIVGLFVPHKPRWELHISVKRRQDVNRMLVVGQL